MTQLWPTTFAGIEEGAGSPLPSIWVIGLPERGKSSLAATTLAQQPLVLDAEGSWATLKYQVPGAKVVQLREKAAAINEKNFHLALFTAMWNELEALQPGQHDLLVIDPTSDLYFGSYAFMLKRPDLVGKAAASYTGTIGNKAQWADSYTLWKHIVGTATTKVQTVVLTSHPKDLVDKASGAKTGKQSFKGVDFTEIVSLKLWLFGPNDADPDGNQPDSPKHRGVYWALNMKSRLSWHVKQEGSPFPRIRPILPKKLVLEPGQSYPELIWKYMDTPKPDYGDLDVVVGDPTRVQRSAEDTAAIEQENLRLKLEAERQQLEREIGAEKNEIYRVLVQERHVFKDPAELLKHIQGLGHESYEDMRKTLGGAAAKAELLKLGAAPDGDAKPELVLKSSNGKKRETAK
jgi:hypothetical protein